MIYISLEPGHQYFPILEEDDVPFNLFQKVFTIIRQQQQLVLLPFAGQCSFRNQTFAKKRTLVFCIHVCLCLLLHCSFRLLLVLNFDL